MPAGRAAVPKIICLVSGGRQTARPSLLAGAGHLAALWALAFAQPIFDLLGRNPDFFVARGNTRWDILVFAFTFALAPPLAMLAAEWACARFSERLRWAVHLLLVAALSSALWLVVLKQVVSRPAGLMIVAAVAAGLGTALAYSRTRFLRSVLDVLIPAPAVVLALFLLFSDASELIFPQSQAEAASVRIPGTAPVVMVVFDELPEGTLMTRQGGIDASRYPAFAELARHSTWYRGATTVAGFTPRAVPAILTGRLPGTEQLPTSADQQRSIFTLLGGSYRMHVMEVATQICPTGLCGDQGRGEQSGRLGSLFSDLRVVSEHLLLPDAMRRGLPAVDVTFGDFANEASDEPPRVRFARNDADRLTAAFGEQVTDNESIRVARFLGGIDSSPRVLHLIHVEKPHYPWTHFASGRKYSDLSSEFKDVLGDDTRWEGSRSLTNLALQRHLLETGFTDRLLADVLGKLKETGIWNRSVVVVTADHGGAFIAHQPRRNPDAVNMGQVAAVPLFVKAPRQTRPRVVDRRVCTTDVLPTVSRLLGIRYPWDRYPCPPGTVTVANSPSGQASLPFARVERQRDRYVRRIDRLFGIGSGWTPVMRFRPHPELIGVPISSLRTSASDQSAATIDEASRLTHVDPFAPVVLASLVRGSVPGGEPGEALAVGVNGRIAAVGRSFEGAGAMRYSMLVPPHFFRPGRNRAEIFRVLGGGSAVELVRLGP